MLSVLVVASGIQLPFDKYFKYPHSTPSSVLMPRVQWVKRLGVFSALEGFIARDKKINKQLTVHQESVL